MARKKAVGRPPRTDDARRTAIYLPGELARWLRIHAAEYDVDMGVVVTTALQLYRYEIVARAEKKHSSIEDRRAALAYETFGRWYAKGKWYLKGE